MYWLGYRTESGKEVRGGEDGELHYRADDGRWVRITGSSEQTRADMLRLWTERQGRLISAIDSALRRVEPASADE